MTEALGALSTVLLVASVMLTGKIVNTRMDKMEAMIIENSEALAYDFKKSQEGIKKGILRRFLEG